MKLLLLYFVPSR